MPLLFWFAFAGYPEIHRVRYEVTADARPGHFFGVAWCAEVVVGDWRGIVCFNPGLPGADRLDTTVAYAREVVEYHRAKPKQPPA